MSLLLIFTTQEHFLNRWLEESSGSGNSFFGRAVFVFHKIRCLSLWLESKCEIQTWTKDSFDCRGTYQVRMSLKVYKSEELKLQYLVCRYKKMYMHSRPRTFRKLLTTASRDSLQAVKLSSVPRLVLNLLTDLIVKDTRPLQQACLARRDQGHDLVSPLLLYPAAPRVYYGSGPHLRFPFSDWTLTA